MNAFSEILILSALCAAIPAFAQAPTPTPSPSPTQGTGIVVEPTFASIHKLIIEPKCLKCHQGADAAHGVDLSTYESIMNADIAPPLVMAGMPEHSDLYKSVRSGKMPKRAQKLPDAEIQAISDWIKNGAKQFENEPGPNPSPSPGNNNGVVFFVEPCDLHQLSAEPGFIPCN